jgi:hypothetical protein
MRQQFVQPHFHLLAFCRGRQKLGRKPSVKHGQNAEVANAAIVVFRIGIEKVGEHSHMEEQSVPNSLARGTAERPKLLVRVAAIEAKMQNLEGNVRHGKIQVAGAEYSRRSHHFWSHAISILRCRGKVC